MKVVCVTLTGADDDVKPELLHRLRAAYPMVEFGILFGGKDRWGTPRYPSIDWVRRLIATKGVPLAGPLPLAAHLCGGWVRDLVEKATFTFAGKFPDLLPAFGRIQINAGGKFDPGDVHPCFHGEMKNFDKAHWILQLKQNVNGYYNALRAGVRVLPFYDASGGQGALPACWPWPCAKYVGYAGGLTPDNLAAQLDILRTVAADKAIWVDVESGIRTHNFFDPVKAEKFLRVAYEWNNRHAHHP